jgi:uncharacterized secreted protein with C-terminal beta-propeller domain
MRRNSILVLLLAQLAVLVFGVFAPAPALVVSLVSFVVFLESMGDFESLATTLIDEGKHAKAPAQMLGKSGVKHEFSLAVLTKSGSPEVVTDTELSVKEVDEMRVLKFYVKVFDVSPKKAILCVCPRLNERARSLAREYGIVVLENDVPRKLVEMAAAEIHSATGEGEHGSPKH